MGSPECVRCGARADLYCARCGVTPYCSVPCQRADWGKRHRSVCHNLMRFDNAVPKVADLNASASEVKEELPKVQPLRQPKSPPIRHPVAQTNTRREEPRVAASPAVQEQPYKKPQPQYNKESKPGPEHDNRNANSNFKPNHNRNRGDNRRDGQSAARNDEQWGDKGDKPAPKPTSAEQSQQKPEQKMNHHAKSPQAPRAPQTQAKAPQTEVKTPRTTSSIHVKPGFKSPAKVEKPLVPAKCLIDEMSAGDAVVLSLDGAAAACRERRAGFVCLSLSGAPALKAQYEALFEAYQAHCDLQPHYTPSPGESFSLFVTEDSAWYRARLLNKNTAALLDAARVVSVDGQKTKALVGEFATILEYCCLLQADGVTLGSQYKAEITSRSEDGVCKVVLKDCETDAIVAKGDVTRWRPQVDDPEPAPAPLPVAAPASAPANNALNQSMDQTAEFPCVPRPALQHGRAAAAVSVRGRAVLVRPGEARAAHDMAEQGVALYGRTAQPLSCPPTKGDLVVARAADGHHYRALVRRTSRARDKYLLEYVESGIEETSSLSRLSACPPEFSLARSPAACSAVVVGAGPLTPRAEEYLQALVDQTVVVSLPDGQTSAPSGSDAILTLRKNNENVNKKLAELCTPDWKKVEESNKTALDTPVLLHSDIEYLPLPRTGALRILDASFLAVGSLSVCAGERAVRQLERLEGALGDMITEYCNSEIGREPYLPRVEELCIAQCPPYEQWFRALRVPDDIMTADTVSVLYLDYGNLSSVQLRRVRKMMPEFVRGEPVAACSLEIRGFPEKLSAAALARAREYLSLDGEEGGSIEVSNCEQIEPGTYGADCPGLLGALRGLI